MSTSEASFAEGLTRRGQPEEGRLSDLWLILRGNKTMLVGIIILIILVLMAFAGPLVAPYGPLDPNPDKQLQPPSEEHLMGTDQYGRDVLSRILYATRLDLQIALFVTIIAFTAGSIIGAISGYVGRLLDDIVMRAVDILMAFPSFILAMAITAMLGNSVQNVILAIAIAYTPYFIRLTRGEVLSRRQAEYVDAARCVGNPDWRIVGFHLLPNSIFPALVQATLVLGWAILDASGLAFLGLGIVPPTPEWGVLVNEGTRNIIGGEWWTYFFPGLAIMLAVFGFNLTGDGLRDILSPE
jgi:peptide/nickel transport system permease protein